MNNSGSGKQLWIGSEHRAAGSIVDDQQWLILRSHTMRNQDDPQIGVYSGDQRAKIQDCVNFI